MAGQTWLCLEGADRIEALEAALREIQLKFTYMEDEGINPHDIYQIILRALGEGTRWFNPPNGPAMPDYSIGTGKGENVNLPSAVPDEVREVVRHLEWIARTTTVNDEHLSTIGSTCRRAADLLERCYAADLEYEGDSIEDIPRSWNP